MKINFESKCGSFKKSIEIDYSGWDWLTIDRGGMLTFHADEPILHEFSETWDIPTSESEFDEVHNLDMVVHNWKSFKHRIDDLEEPTFVLDLENNETPNGVVLTQEQIEYIQQTLKSTRDLLDNVHCYETPQFDACKIAIRILDGYTVEEAKELCKND